MVHESHGLGIYQGIEKVEMDKVVKDYIKIEYRDGGNLYVLATGLDVIQKYASADARKPRLNKLGSKEWDRTKTKVRSAVSQVAKDINLLWRILSRRPCARPARGTSMPRTPCGRRNSRKCFPLRRRRTSSMP